MCFEDPVFWKCAYIWKTSEEKVSKNTVRTSMRKTCKNHPKNEQKTHQKSSKNKPKKHTEKLTTQFQPRGRKRCPKIGRQGGKGGIQDGILLEKKKNIAKTRPTAGKGCMREGNTQTVTESQHAPAVGRKRPGGEFGLKSESPFVHFWWSEFHLSNGPSG